MRTASVAASLLLVLALATPAGAYSASGADAAGDVHDVRVADIVATTVRVWRTPSGDRWFRVRITTTEPVTSGVLLDTRIDAAGDRAADRVVRIVIDVAGVTTCFVGRSLGDGDREGLLVIDGRRTACLVPLALIAPERRIRWRVVSYPHEAGTLEDRDRAPDRGWYRS